MTSLQVGDPLVCTSASCLVTITVIWLYFQYEFTVSFLEIYNEVIRDLLGSGKDDAKHEIRLVAAGSSEIFVTDLTTINVNNQEQVCIKLLTVDSSAIVIGYYTDTGYVYLCYSDIT